MQIANGQDGASIRALINAVLPDGSPVALAGSDLIGVNQGSGTRPVSLSAIAAFLGAGATPSTPSISLTNPSVAEGNSGQSALVFTLTVVRNGVSGALPFTGSVTGGTANSIDFFGGAVPTIAGTIASGSNTASISLAIAGDTTVETDETVAISVVLTGYSAATATAIGTITNDDVASAPATIAGITQQALANRVAQRDTFTGGGQGKGQGSFKQKVNISAAGTLWARCRSVADGTTILQAAWKFLDNAPTGNTDRIVTGIDARLEPFYLDISGDGTDFSNGTATVAIRMGDLTLGSGQSEMTRLLKNSSDISTSITGAGVTISPHGYVFAAADTGDGAVPTAWVLPANGGAISSAGVAEYLRLMVALTGVSQGFVAKSEGQTAIEQWLPGTTLGDGLVATMQAAGGKFLRVWEHIGHSNSGNSTQSSVFAGGLASFFAMVASNNSFPTPRQYLTTIPNIADTTWGQNYQIEAAQRGGRKAAAALGITHLPFIDAQLASDNVHYVQSGAIRAVHHLYRAERTAHGAANDNKTTRLTAIAVVGGNFELTFTGGNLSQVGTPLNRFRAYKRGDRSSPIALSALGINNSTKKITLTPSSALPAGAFDVFWGGGIEASADGSANLLVDDITDGDGITQGRPLFADVVPLRTTASRDLVPSTSPAPTYGAGKFGRTMVTGWGETATPSLPSIGEGWRVDAWLKQSTTGDGLKVYFGGSSIYLTMNDGTLAFNCASTAKSYTGILSGTAAWVCFICDAPCSTIQVWVNAVLIDTVATNNPANAAMSVGYGVRTFGGVAGFECGAGQMVDEVAVWRGAGPAITGVPTAALAGTEDELVGLYRFEDNALNLAVAA